MHLDTFHTAEAQVIRQTSQPDPPFRWIGEAWEIRLMAEAYCILGPPNLIISDGLSFIVDRLLRDNSDAFVFVTDEDADSADVYILERLIEDLKEGAELLMAAVDDDQVCPHPRILQSTADHVRAIGRRLAVLG